VDQPDAMPTRTQSPRSVRWILVLGTVILTGALIVVNTPPRPVPEAILIRTNRSLGTFTATGDAVDSGRACEGGVFWDQRPPGPPRPPAEPFFDREFICDDGSAPFRIRGQTAESAEARSEGTWRFVPRPFSGTHFEGEGRFFADGKFDKETLRITYIGKVNVSP